ncbi:hypothetical protein VPNG_04717 [Cytospora leucostoma]|uniref:Uncharacterized protein n=1 Tax=Cytospora leucostoma TaxID=1230097 RepID=A0A423XAF8_9PEZI|nr:hypothetical protein VPNG_04717 [Cytospora leucostoma]
MAAPAHILRLPLKGSPASHVLVRVVPRSSAGSRPLDLELTATDDEQAYVRILQHSKIARYRDQSSSLSEDEWEQCLASLLLPGVLPDLDVTAKLNDDTLTINVRRQVSGQDETLGSLTLEASEEATENIDIFDWCSDAVEARSRLERELEELRRKHADLEKLVAEETEHFKELERSKNEFEASHDAFLRDLLNEKKLKIRTQGQILATAQVDEDKLAAVSAKANGGGSAAASRRPGAVGASRKGKRKAGGAATAEDEVDDDATADLMDIDTKPESPVRDLEEQLQSDADQTTEGSETASEPEPEPELEPEPRKTGRSSTRNKGVRASPSPPAKTSRASDEHPSSNLRGKSPAAAHNKKEDKVPPPRALPFKKKPAPAPVPADDESTASEAEEL